MALRKLGSAERVRVLPRNHGMPPKSGPSQMNGPGRNTIFSPRASHNFEANRHRRLTCIQTSNRELFKHYLLLQTVQCLRHQ